MAALSWHRFRTSCNEQGRSETHHYANTEHGPYRVEKIGTTYVANHFPRGGGETFVVARKTLKEAKREAGYHFNALTQEN